MSELTEAEREKRLEEKRKEAKFHSDMKSLNALADGIETFEDAFLAHIVMPDGSTVAEHTLPRIAAAYDSGKMQPLLPAPRGGENG